MRTKSPDSVPFFSVQIARFRSLLRLSATPLLQVASTRAFMHFMTFLVTVSLARELGPTGFGIYALAILVGTSLSELLLGTGVDMAAVRLSAPHWHEHPERAWSVFRLVGLIKTILGAGLFLVGFFSAEFLSEVLLHRPESAIALRTAAVAVLALALTEFALSILQARQDFRLFAILGSGVALIRAVPLLILIVLHQTSVSTVLTVYACSLYLGCTLALAPSWRALTSHIGSRHEITKEFLGYTGWISLTVVFGTMANVVDTLALTYFKGAQAVGIYAAARTFATGVTVLTMASTAVLLPRFGRMTDRQARRHAIGNAAYLIGGFAVLVALGIIFTASHLVKTFYGAPYLDAIPVLQILACAYSLELATTTLAVFLLVENRPDVLAKATALGLLVSLTGYAWLIPPFGALGAAIVLLSGRLVSTLICLAWAILSLSPKGLSSNAIQNAVDLS